MTPVRAATLLLAVAKELAAPRPVPPTPRAAGLGVTLVAFARLSSQKRSPQPRGRRKISAARSVLASAAICPQEIGGGARKKSVAGT